MTFTIGKHYRCLCGDCTELYECVKIKEGIARLEGRRGYFLNSVVNYDESQYQEATPIEVLEERLTK